MSRAVVPATPRKAMTPKRRRDAYQSRNGLCGMCRGFIPAGAPFDVDHQIPLFMGGKDELANWQILHPACHREKTNIDLGKIAKVKRLIAGPTPSKRPLKSRGFQTDLTRGFDGKTRRRA